MTLYRLVHKYLSDEVIIYPAIDLRQGRVVRLHQGDPNAQTIYSDDPVSTAQRWADQGAEWLHVVNLDGAFGRTLDAKGEKPINLHWLKQIRQAVSIPIQFGGGVRTLDDIGMVLEMGAKRVVLGTVAVENPTLVSEALQRWGAERIVVGLDARDGKVATHGWQKVSKMDVVEMGHHMYAMGVRRVLYTDVSRDGTMSGVNHESTARLGDSTGLYVIASGGVGGIEDITRLKEYEHYNIDGVIVGKSIYAGALDLPAAIQLGHQPLTSRSAGLIPFRRTAQGVEFLLLYHLFWEQWQFPRCRFEAGESEIACAQRALREKTGLALHLLHAACRSELHYTAQVRQYSIQRTVIYFLAEVGSGEIQMDHENHCESRWVNAEEAHQLLAETSPEQLPALEQAVRYLEQANR